MRYDFAALSLALLGLCNVAFARGDLLQGIPLQWVPSTTMADMGPLDVDGALRITPIHFDAFTDQRQNPSLVGENHDDGKVRPVTTSTDVAAYLSTHMRDLARASSLYVSDAPNALHLSAEIRIVLRHGNRQLSRPVLVALPPARREGQGVVERHRQRRSPQFRPLVQSR